MKSSNNKRGFTLIELLAVIAILAILLIIAIPSVIKMYNNAKINTFVDEVQSVINTAEKQYMADQINSDAPTCYSNDATVKTQEGCTELDLSGNKNLKYYVEFENGHIINAQVDDGTHTWKGEIPEGITGKIEASSVTTEGINPPGITPDGVIELTEVIPDPVSFATDSWATIQKAVREGNTSNYSVGTSTRCIALNGFTTTNDNGCSDGQFLVRVANKSECTNGETSETACGFVVEFVDIVTTHVMNATPSSVGGWPGSELYTYVQNTLFNALPEELTKIISETKVISSYGPSDSGNFTTRDKLYLLSGQEVWGTSYSAGETSNGTSRQLDYYAQNNVTTSNFSLANKQHNTNYYNWWLRSATFNLNNAFENVNGVSGSQAPFGVSPAFRIS